MKYDDYIDLNYFVTVALLKLKQVQQVLKCELSLECHFFPFAEQYFLLDQGFRMLAYQCLRHQQQLVHWC